MQASPFIGIDITSVARIAAVTERRPALLARVFSPAELSYCNGRARQLATRWAAKEAVRKLAGQIGVALPAWREIEIHIGSRGAPWASVLGWPNPVAVSLSHEADQAIAVATVVAVAMPLLPDLSGVVLPSRAADSHKGSFGTVLVVAGSVGMSGAALLAAYGAARSGAGLVRACVPQSIYPVIAGQMNEIMVQPVAEAAGALAPAGVAEILAGYMHGAAAVVVGCGLGRTDSTAAALMELLPRLEAPAVIDADALTLCAARQFVWRDCPKPLVLTPHPGEMARLINSDVAAVQHDRTAVARAYAAQSGAVVVLKGAHTVVAAPDGRTHVDNSDVVALATGGTGDVLAGVCAGMLAQGLDSFDAAVAAVTIHAVAGMAAQQSRGRAGAVAGDLLLQLPQAQERIRRAIEVQI